MEIEIVRHKARRAYIQTGHAKGLDARLASRIRNMIAFITAARDPEELRIPPNFGFHWLTGDRSRTAAMTLTKNWRMTFAINDDGKIIDLDLEDYH
jgi:toxin HigB-1